MRKLLVEARHLAGMSVRLSSLRQIVGSVDWSPGLVGLMALLAMQPLLAGRLTRSTDGLLHLYRLVDLDRAVRAGILLPRWLPDLAGGYGIPLFNFYPPLAYYPIELLHLAGLSLVHALLIFFGLTIWLASGAMFLWLRDIAGAPAGLLGAVAYAYAPYTLHNVYGRANPSEALALALAPLLFWAFRRLALVPTGRHLAIASMTYAAMVTTHLPSTAIFTVPLICYVGLLFWHERPRMALPPVVAAFILGLGLSALVWMPAFIEKGWVQLERMQEINYATNFLQPAGLLSWGKTVDRRLMNPDVERSLGPALLILAAAGMLSGLFGKRSQRAHVWAAFVLLVVSIAFTLPLSRWAWDHLPLLADLQLPRRFMAPATLALAFLAGQIPLKAYTAAQEPRYTGSCVPVYLYTCVPVFLCVVSSLPFLFPSLDRWTPATPSVADLLAFEERTGAIGTTATGEYLPIWAKEMPPGRVGAQIRAGDPVERLDPASLPPGTEVQAADYGFTSAQLTVTGPESFQAVFESFYFPGWQAYVDGRQVPVTPTAAGLISFEVPAGTHTLVVRFEDTPVRTSATLVSIISMASLALVILRRPKLAQNPNLQAATLFSVEGKLWNLEPRLWLAAGLFVATGCAVKTFYLDRFDTWLAGSRFDGQQVQGVAVNRRDVFGDEVTLLGYDLPDPVGRAGEPFRVKLYWQARRPLVTNYSTFVHVVDDVGEVRAGSDHLHPGNYPTTRWEPDEYAQDEHALDLPPDLPPGEYTLTVGVYDPIAKRRLKPPERGELAVGRVRIQGPRSKVPSQPGTKRLSTFDLGLHS